MYIYSTLVPGTIFLWKSFLMLFFVTNSYLIASQLYYRPLFLLLLCLATTSFTPTKNCQVLFKTSMAVYFHDIRPFCYLIPLDLHPFLSLHAAENISLQANQL